MIIFKDILGQLKQAGWSTYRLQQEKILQNSIIKRLRHNQSITTNTVDVICDLLNCQPNDIMEHKKERD